MKPQLLFIAAAAFVLMGEVFAETPDAGQCDAADCSISYSQNSIDTAETSSRTSTAADEEGPLDYLKGNPNYSSLFVKEPNVGERPATDADRSTSRSATTAAPVTEANYLDHLRTTPIYTELLKSQAESAAESEEGTSPQPACVDYYTYVCDKDTSPKEKESDKTDTPKRSPEERATAAANSIAEVFTGDVKDACEALLCLSSGERPSECEPPIRRYLSIVRRSAGATTRARAEFLAMCPISKRDN